MGHAQGDGVIDERDAPAGSGRGEGVSSTGRHGAEQQEAGFGGVQPLASGVAKGVHGGKKRGELGWGVQEDLGIVSIHAGAGRERGGGEEVASAEAAGAQEAEQGLGDKQVKHGREGAALAHAGLKGGRARDEAVDEAASGGGGEEEPDEGNKSRGEAQGFEGAEEEGAVNGVKGLAAVEKKQQGPAARGAQAVGEEL